MKKFLLPLLLIFLFPVALATMQASAPTPRFDITGVNASELPTAVITVEVVDSLGQPVAGLTQENFTLSGDLAEVAQIVNVESVTDDNLSFAVVLVIDTSSSMAGRPIELAKEAAIEFVNNIGENDPVAIITFNSTVQLVQDYTSDKAVLLEAINRLQFGGETNLYEGALAGVEKAAQASTARRAVILLSDGAQYITTTRDVAAREVAQLAAQSQGVPVYTIGLGFGTDRTYLEDISGVTNARFYESPTPDELSEIYSGLARLFRSFYIVTLDAQVAQDGTEYNFTMKATTPQGDTNEDSAVLRAPIPIPLVSVDPQPGAEPLTTATDFTATVKADDTINDVAVTLDGQAITSLIVAPYTFSLDPFALAPGQHTLTFAATDSTGDVGSAEVVLEVGSLPAVVSLNPDLTTLGEISESTTVTLDVSEQTPTTGVNFSVDEGEATASTTAPFNFTIDPFVLTPGEHTLSVETTSDSGAIGTTTGIFSVAALPPRVTVTGLEASGETVTENRVISVDVAGQTETEVVDFVFDGATTIIDDTAPYEIPLNPELLTPGEHTLDVVATSVSGASTTSTLNFIVAALPPVVTVSGLTEDELLGETRPLAVEVTGQTPAESVVFAVDGNRLATDTEAPFEFTINPFEFDASQPHLFQVLATNQGGQSTTSEIRFNVAPPPTATPTSTFTPTPTPTFDIPATNAAATQAAQSTLEAQLTADAQGTSDAATALIEATNAAGTKEARTTLNAQITLSAQETAAQATLNIQATINAELATVDARLTAAAQQTADAQLTAGAAMTQDAQATLDVEATARVKATTDAELAELDARLTAEAQETTDAMATEEVLLTETEQQSALNAAATASSEPPATNTPRSTSTLAPTLTPTEAPTDTVEPTATATLTEAPTDTLVPTEAPTDPTEPAATEEVTEVAQAVTEVTTEEVTVTTEPTDTPTQLAAEPSATEFDATSTPGSPTEVTAPTTDTQDTTLPLLAIACGVALLIFLIVLFILARRRRDQ